MVLFATCQPMRGHEPCVACAEPLLARGQIVMNIPFTAIYFATYESAKKALGAREAQQEETLLVQLLAGGLAGGAAAGLTTPLDVVKTRLQLAGVNSPTRYSGSALVRCWHRSDNHLACTSRWRHWLCLCARSCQPYDA